MFQSINSSNNAIDFETMMHDLIKSTVESKDPDLFKVFNTRLPEFCTIEFLGALYDFAGPARNAAILNPPEKETVSFDLKINSTF
jgi:hypothetical protein